MSPNTDEKAPTGIEMVDRPCPTCGSRSFCTEASGLDYEYDTSAERFTFVCCERCTTIYLQPRPAAASFDVIYPRSYYAHEEAEGTSSTPAPIRMAWALVERRRARGFRALLGEGTRRVLDIGCGDGRLLATLRELGGRSWELVGVEPGLSDEARRRAAARGLELHDGLYEDVDLGEERVDLIVAQQVLEHVVEPKAALEKMYRELRPGGYAVIDTPNADGLDRALFGRGLWGGYHFPRHMTLFSPVTLADAAGRVGFDVVEVRPMLSPVFWITTLHNGAVALGWPRRITARITYRSLPLLVAATLIDLPLHLLAGRTSNMRMVLRRPE